MFGFNFQHTRTTKPQNTLTVGFIYVYTTAKNQPKFGFGFGRSLEPNFDERKVFYVLTY